MQVEVIATEELGDRSYVVHDGTTAVVVDPQRDLDRVEAVLQRLSLTVGLVVETHIHNDYVTGGYELARRTGAGYAVNAEDPVDFDRMAVSDGDELSAGHLRVSVMATPGHTVTHLSYVVRDETAPDEAPAVFTGGSLLYGSVGRTDLVDPARTLELTHAQFHSARQLADTLPDAAPVFPTHGFGSFCSSGPTAGGNESTIGIERGRNDALTAADEQSFVDTLIRNLTAYPAYYAHMAPRNLAGPTAPDLTAPEPVDATELGKRIDAGEWVVDLRDRVAYAADHLGGSISIALGDQFATYLGWLAPWGAPLTLMAETADQIAAAQRQLVRIGIDRLAGASVGDATGASDDKPRSHYPRVTFTDVARRPEGSGVILDVRRDDEWADGHIAGSQHIPLQQILARMDEVPQETLWVHCASGFRASIAASLLDRAGHDVVYIDDDFANAAAAGLVIT